MTILIDNDKWQAEHGGWGGLERIDINVDDPVEVDSTCQLLGHNRWSQYNVVTKVVRQDAHVVRYHIRYNEENNAHLFPPNGRYEQKDFTWGTHILILKKNEDSGESIWNDEEGPGWRVEKLIGRKRKITTTKLQRDQARFRQMLLATYDRCALTGETCPEALEAAHIVPVKYGGQEILPNGILLRADLHRIYDADPAHFDICAETGEVFVHPRYESFDLANARIPEPILSRIAEALRARANLCPAR